jgi:phosphoribosylanthranilate isomerase
MREEDAALAGVLGAAYVGMIFAGGPRLVTAEQARRVGAAAGDGPRRVGVFADQSAEEVSRVAATAALDVVQLHLDPSPDRVAAVRAATGLEVWAAVRLAEPLLPAGFAALADAADALVLDAKVAGSLGGTGVRLDWPGVAQALAPWRGRVPIVLAGGLDAENLSRAIAIVAPDVVDVSSGVEERPGQKNHAAMRAFARAALAGSPA